LIKNERELIITQLNECFPVNNANVVCLMLIRDCHLLITAHLLNKNYSVVFESRGTHSRVLVQYFIYKITIYR
jgi:hypothetical protein